MSEGIIFYNYSNGSAARLVVAVHSLRKHYQGDVAILSDGPVSDELCKHFANDNRLGVRVINGFFDVKIDRNHHYLSKCRVHEISPFDVSIYIDADTVSVNNVSDLFPLATTHEFVVPQFSDWRTDTGGMVARRIQQWKDIKPADITPALAFGPAVNTGVYAFVRESKFMHDWFRISRKGRRLFIPDESGCQLVLYRYPHKVVEWFYNASCKYDNCQDPSVRIVHFHGRKHCREGLPHNADIWVKAYNEVCDLNIANINDWTPGGDRKLRHYLKSV